MPKSIAKISVVSLVAATVTMMLSSQSAFSFAKDVEKITAVEKILYFKTYSDESLEKRVKRLEKRYFGESGEGDLESRVEKIYNLAKPQIEAAQKKQTPSEVVDDNDSKGDAQKSFSKQKTNFEDPDRKSDADKLAVLKARDAEINTMLKEGISFWKKKDSKRAEERFLQVTRLDPRNAEAFFSLGVLYEARGDLNNALKSYNRSNYINPNNMDYKRAIVDIKSRIEKEGQKNALATEAAEAFKRKEYISALNLYKRLETENPDKALYKYNIGTIYLLMKNPQLALNYYGKAVKIEPGEPRYQRAYQKLSGTLKISNAKRKEREAEWDRLEAAKNYNKRRNFAPPQNQGKPTNMAPPQNRLPQNNFPPQQVSQMPTGYQPPAGQQPMQPGFQPPPQNPQPGPGPGAITPQMVDKALSTMGINSAQATPAGIVISNVNSGSRADASGIRPGDIIISVNGLSVQSTKQLALLLSKVSANQKAQLILKRQGQVGQIMF